MDPFQSVVNDLEKLNTITYLKKHHGEVGPRLFKQMTPSFELEILNLLLLSVDEKIVNSFASTLELTDRKLWKTIWMDR